MRKNEGVFLQPGEVNFHQKGKERKRQRRKRAKGRIGKILLIILIVWIGFIVNRRVEEARFFKEIEKEKKIQLAYEQSLMDLEIKGDQLFTWEMFRESAVSYRNALQILKFYVKDPAKEEAIRKKYQITGWIVAGEKSIANGRYGEALQKYLKADQLLEPDNYNKAKINERIGALHKRVEFENAVKEGDTATAHKNFSDALQSYNHARTIAGQLALQTEINALEGKIAKAREELGQLREEAEKLEKLADRKYREGDYHEAAKTYHAAEMAYDKLGLSHEKLMTDKKAKDAEKRSKSFWKRFFAGE
jgi:tetratricopeptide (TPR) repeat protein